MEWLTFSGKIRLGGGRPILRTPTVAVPANSCFSPKSLLFWTVVGGNPSTPLFSSFFHHLIVTDQQTNNPTCTYNSNYLILHQHHHHRYVLQSINRFSSIFKLNLVSFIFSGHLIAQRVKGLALEYIYVKLIINCTVCNAKKMSQVKASILLPPNLLGWTKN